MSSSDPTTRFSDRVDNYVRYRPSYPEGVLPLLERVTGLGSHSVIADLGSGTGISAELFLRRGTTVYGVEPNEPMRHAAERLLEAYPRFHSVDGRAEATTLDGASVDLVVAAQAFHWFDVAATRAEVLRILRPDGWAILLWNTRRLDTTPFLRAYEALLQRFGTDYREVQHSQIPTATLEAFFGGAHYQRHVLDYNQELDFDGIRGRLLSSSYVPTEEHADYAPMLAELERIVAVHGSDGHVALEYETEVYVGRVRGEG